MSIISKSSLAKTLDAFNEADFLGKKLAKPERTELAKWLAERQGLKGSYSGMVAPTARDFKDGIRLFTGERMDSGAGVSHVLGEEASRALLKLNVKLAGVQAALSRAIEGKARRLDYPGRRRGWYCCGTCSASYWRRLMVMDDGQAERELSAGVRLLKGYRDGKGRWRRFPFYHTLLALSELDHRAALSEMRYAAPSLERVVKRRTGRDKYARRRLMLAERILARL